MQSWLLACAVFEREIARYGAGAPLAGAEYFPMGLHDHPDNLRRSLQEAIDRLAGREDIGAVVLAYGLCGLGTAGLRARRQPLVLPRGHDCITLFLGSLEAYEARMRECPGCYFYTPGWNRGRRVPGPDRLAALRSEWEGKFDADAVEFLLETERGQWSLHDTAVFVDLDTPDAGKEKEYARACAEWLGWKFEPVRGEPGLLRDLLHGPWDEGRFLMVPPGCEVRHSPGGGIVEAVEVPA